MYFIITTSIYVSYRGGNLILRMATFWLSKSLYMIINQNNLNLI